MNRPNYSRWKSVRAVLADSLGQPGADPSHSIDWFAFHWNLIVGRELTGVTCISKLSGKSLFVTVSDRKWFPALKSFRAKIIAEVNQRAGSPVIDRIVFQEGPVASSAGPPVSVRKVLFPPGQHKMEGNKTMAKDESLQDILDRVAAKLLTVPLAVMLLFISNCSTLPTEPISGSIDLSDSYAVRTVDELAKKQSGRIARDPRAYYHYLMALKEVRRHQFEKAAEHFRKVVEFEVDDSLFHRQLAMNLLRAGKLDEAYQALEESLHHFANNSELNMMMADLLAGKEEYQRALTHYQRVIQAEPSSARAHLLRGTIYEQLNQHGLAADMYKKVIQVEPGNPLGFHYLARVNILSGELKEARGNLERALELRPNLRHSREYLAWVWEQLGDVEKAARQYKILLKLDPLNKKIHERLTTMPTVFAMPADVNTAEYRSNAEAVLGAPQVHMKIGAVYYEQSLHLKALDEFQLVRLQFQSKEILMVLTRVYEILDRVDRAIDELEVLRKMEPKSVNLMIYAARLYSINGQAEATVRLLEEAIDTEPENDTLYHSLALAYMSTDRFDEAVSKMRQAIALNENKDSYYFELGALLERAGEYKSAIKNMKRAIELNPMHSNAHNFLGYMYALQGESLDQALDHLQKALSIQPRNGFFRDSLGWIYFKKGESERALMELKKAMVYTSPDPVLYSHLGDIYFSLKNYFEAGKAWETSLFLTRENEKNFEGEMPNRNDLEGKIQKAQDLLNNN
ncbi:MAG: DUF721 domain-containing protein [Nitrospinae bacterium]|nr:DUF721 domain-containing protein [Nitrospinota bacterium]